MHNYCNGGAASQRLYRRTDTPTHRMQGVLPSSRGLATVHHWSNDRGPLSRSVLQGKPVGFQVPPSTASNGRKRFLQDILGCVVISVQHHATAKTNVCTHTQRFLDHRSTR